jgi:chromosome segregation ATPase
MSNKNSNTPDKKQKTRDTRTTLADIIQDAQDIIENLEDDVPAEALNVLESVDDDIEKLEDTVEDNEGSLPDGFEDNVQAAQDDIENLQETLNLAGAGREVIARAEDLEDTVEAIEDRIADVHDHYGVKVGNDPIEFFDEESPTAEEILARFGKDTDDALVEKGTENTYSGDDEVPLGGPGIERFTAEPRTDGNS